MSHDVSRILERIYRLATPPNCLNNYKSLERCFDTRDELLYAKTLPAKFMIAETDRDGLEFFYKELYGLACLFQLWRLHLCLTEVSNCSSSSNNNDNTKLGAKDQRAISSLMILIFSWLVSPQLEIKVVNHLQNIKPVERSTDNPRETTLMQSSKGISKPSECNESTSNDLKLHTNNTHSTYSPAFLQAIVVTVNSMIGFDTLISKKIKSRYISTLLASLIQLQHCEKPAVRACQLPPLEDILCIFRFSEPARYFENYLLKCTTHSTQEEIDKLLKSTNLQNTFLILISLANIKNVNWMSSQCSRRLSSLILGKNGLINMLQALLPREKETLKHNQIAAISRLVTAPPLNMNIVDYYKIMAPQLHEILNKLTQDRLEYIVCVSIIALMCKKVPDTGYYLIIYPLIDRLTLIDVPRSVASNYITNKRDIHGRDIVATHEYIEKTLIFLSSLTENIYLSQELASCMLNIVPQLYCMYEVETAWHKGSEPKQLLDILGCIIGKSKPDDVLSTFRFIMVDLRKTAITETSRDEDGNLLIVLNKAIGRNALDTSLFSKLITMPSIGTLSGEVFLYILELVSMTSDSLYDDKIILIDIVLHLLEDGSSNILQNPLQILEFARKTLLLKDTKMITLAVGLIYTVVTSDVLKPDAKPNLDMLLKTINTVPDCKDEVLSGAFRELKDLINSYTVFYSNHGTRKPRSEASDILDNSLKELQDELLPVRAHAMSEITKLVRNKDECILLRLETIFSSATPNLAHEDSFVYLSAVKLLCSLTVNYPQFCLEKIIKCYNDPINLLEIRLRVAEVILQSIKSLGQLFPVYSDIYIHGIIKNLRDKQPKILASTLSLISSIADEQALSLSRYIYTILESVKNIMVFETDKEVRRGATAVLSNLVVYIESHALTNDNILILKQIYTILKRLASSDDDNVVRATSKSFVSYMERAII